MRKETVRLSVGCLLHDIGKPIFRAGLGTGDHSSLGRDFLKTLWPEEKALSDCALYHHAARLKNAKLPPDSMAYIVYAADNLSSAADRRDSEEEGGFVRQLPLSTVFTHLNGEHPGFTVPPYAMDGRLRMPETGGAKLNPQQYQAAVEALQQRLSEMPVGEEWLDSLLCLLESHTSMFPSSTYTGESPDISLYDHLKTTAAIGSCMGEYLAEQGEQDLRQRLLVNESAFREEAAFLLYSADFSGIQRFLYQVASDGALRSLRSRSFFLELAMEHYCDELLRACGVSRANLLYSGGGHCYALLPNTEEVKAALTRWNRRFNDWLGARFGASLFLAQGYTPCSGNELCNHPAEKTPYKAMFRRVSAALSRHKLHRYDAAQLRLLNKPERGDGRECKICGQTASLKGDRCHWCELFLALSEKIQTKDIYFVSEDAASGWDLSLPTPEGEVYISLTDEKTARARLGDGEAVRRIYSKNKSYTGLRYSSRIYVGDYAYSNRMDVLSGETGGIRRIGVCRMDVDDLGQSFVAGFERQDTNDPVQRQHYVTLSRTAAFSRQLSLFFKCYINDILSGRFEKQKPLAVTLVYSGGDDVFLVGAWQDAIQAACRIRRALDRFSCGSLRISGGLCLVSDRYPIRSSAAMAGELEDRAKQTPEKNAIALFDPRQEHCYHWQEFEQEVLGEKLAALEAFFQSREQERGSSFLYRVLALLRGAQEKEGRMQLARYAYLLARLQPSRKDPGYGAYQKFSENMYRWALDETARQRLITAIYIFVYQNRKREDR